ncbi:hypothetical protein PYW08_011450 [Mythimna loreyi]|uniref:Uncharacterized protein n=1 Tax=Mythimna loreyi TaxID=667449 RepID=A0ACC2QLE7_9NEOP|nr:hypothetical protein PYW08_011450 [Mythimna loreyi]
MADNTIASSCYQTPLLNNDVQSLLNISSDMYDDSIKEDLQSRAEKRGREDSTEDEEGWTEVKGSKKKVCHGSNQFLKEDKFEVYASSKEPLPKQFAMARILKENNITQIRLIKYLSPFKMRIEFDCESAAQYLLTR